MVVLQYTAGTAIISARASWVWLFGRNCSRGEPYQSLDCLFEPLSTCDGSSVTEENSFAIPVSCLQFGVQSKTFAGECAV